MNLLPRNQSTKVCPYVRKMNYKTVAKKQVKRKMITSTMLTKAVGLEFPALDEDFDEDSLAFLQAQRINEVKIVADHLAIKYSDGREGSLKVGYWTNFIPMT